MNLSQALKQKNRLALLIKEQQRIVTSNVNYLSQNPTKKDMHERAISAMSKLSDVIAELVVLKTKIHVASAPIREDIFNLSELKSQFAFWKGLGISEGQNETRYVSTGHVDVYQSAISENERMGLVEHLQREIDRIQDKIDAFNATTTI